MGLFIITWEASEGQVTMKEHTLGRPSSQWGRIITRQCHAK